MDLNIKTTTTMTWIKDLTSENTGGGCMVDFIHLKDGRVIGITDECAVLYDSMEAFDNSDGTEPSITL